MAGGRAEGVDEDEPHPSGDIDVGNDDVGGLALQDFEPVDTVDGLDHAVALLREGHEEHVPHRAGIIHRQHCLAHNLTPEESALREAAPNSARPSAKSVDGLITRSVFPSIAQLRCAARSTCRQSPPRRCTCAASISTEWSFAASRS